MVLTQSQLAWRKSRYSTANSSNCVEVAPVPDGGMAVRDSKNPTGPVLRFTSREWGAFLASLKDDAIG